MAKDIESMEENLAKIRGRLEKNGLVPKKEIEQNINKSRSTQCQEICDILLDKTPDGEIRLNHVFEAVKHSLMAGRGGFGTFKSKEDMDDSFVKIANLCGRKVNISEPFRSVEEN